MSVDVELKKREDAGKPIRVGIVGAGATGRAWTSLCATSPSISRSGCSSASAAPELYFG